ALGVPVPGHHRALQDAHLAREVFLALLARIRATRVDLLLHVLRLAPTGWAYYNLFAEAERAQHSHLLEMITDGSAPGADLGLTDLLSAPERNAQPLVPNQQTRKVDVDALREALGPRGAIAGLLPAYEERPEQLAMLEAVCDAFNRSQHLIVEAGTG